MTGTPASRSIGATIETPQTLLEEVVLYFEFLLVDRNVRIPDDRRPGASPQHLSI